MLASHSKGRFCSCGLYFHLVVRLCQVPLALHYNLLNDGTARLLCGECLLRDIQVRVANAHHDAPIRSLLHHHSFGRNQAEELVALRLIGVEGSVGSNARELVRHYVSGVVLMEYLIRSLAAGCVKLLLGGLNKYQIFVLSILGRYAVVDICRGKRSLSWLAGLLVARLLLGYLHTDVARVEDVAVVVAVLNAVRLAVVQFKAESGILQLAVDIDVALALGECALEEGGFGRICSVAIADAGAEANHTVVETEHRLACYEVGSEVLHLALHKLHGKHSVHSFKRTRT